nr:protein FAR1-RELATED SEQUENCE 1-like [Quercus suber]
MSTTQLSESMNAFFDGYVGPKTTLNQFVDQYGQASKSKVEKENTEDCISLTSRVPCITYYAIEKQFQDSYTNSKFQEVQDEIRRKMYCHPFLLKQEGAISTYQVVDEIEIDDDTKEVTFHVYFNEDELEVQCNCCLFEFRGILCRHAFSVLMMIKKIKILPSKYILPRWSKDLKQRYTFIKCIYNELSGNPKAQRYDKLHTSFYEVASMASKTEESCMTVMTVLDKLKEKLSLNMSSSESGQTSHHTPGAMTISNEVINGTSKKCIKVLSPLVARSKG